MGYVIESKTILTSTDIGLMAVELKRLRGFTIEDLLRTKAVSEGRRVQFINIGQNIDVNNPKAARTIDSIYFKNDIELPSS